jgi:hypothetical protein
MRKARVCYDHLAGEMGVRMFDALVKRRHLALREDGLGVTRTGARYLADFGVEMPDASRRPLCRSCLDWSMRRQHLAGALGAALLDRIYELKWARRDRNSRAVLFTPNGEAKFKRLFA